MIRQCLVIGLIACVAAGCSRGPAGNGTLSTGPDPFSVLPSKPLQDPPNFQTLPQPELNAANLTDATPLSDGAVALGGRAEARGIPASDQALIAYVSRNGRDADIRTTVNSGTSLFGRGMILDAYAEFERLRALGVATPTAPPRR